MILPFLMSKIVNKQIIQITIKKQYLSGFNSIIQSTGLL